MNIADRSGPSSDKITASAGLNSGTFFPYVVCPANGYRQLTVTRFSRARLVITVPERPITDTDLYSIGNVAWSDEAAIMNVLAGYGIGPAANDWGLYVGAPYGQTGGAGIVDVIQSHDGKLVYEIAYLRDDYLDLAIYRYAGRGVEVGAQVGYIAASLTSPSRGSFTEPSFTLSYGWPLEPVLSAFGVFPRAIEGLVYHAAAVLPEV